ADGRAGRNRPHSERLGHLERVFDLVVGRVAALVEAEDLDVDAGLVELPPDRFECFWRDRGTPLAEVLLLLAHRLLLLGGQRSTAAAPRAATGTPLTGGPRSRRPRPSRPRSSGAAPSADGGGRLRRSSQGLAVTRHDFGFTQPALDHRGDDLLGRERAIAVRD